MNNKNDQKDLFNLSFDDDIDTILLDDEDTPQPLLDNYPAYSTIVVEISRTKQLSRPELTELDPCFKELLNYAVREKKRVVCMASEDYAVYYLFVRTDSVAGTYAALGELEALFSDPDFYKGTAVYMKRLRLDSYDLGRKILENADIPFVYTDKETVSYIPRHRGGDRFAVKYSLDQMYGYCKSRIMGQDEQLKKALYLIDKFVVDMSLGEETAPASFFLTAPSGSGKTELYRSVKEFFLRKDVPVSVVNIDMTQLTPAGYKGDSIGVIADRIRPNRYAVCFLDEADKKLMPAPSDGETDFNAATQASLLRMLEGTIIAGEMDSRARVDTSKVLFILMGSFQEVRDRRCEARSSCVGFGTRAPREEVRDFSDDVTLDDMIEAGMLEEIAGRVSRVINFRPIGRGEMRLLLQDKAEKLGAERNAEIVLTRRAIEELLPMCYTRLGIRKPMNLIRELADDALTEAAFSGQLDENGINVVIIQSLTSAVFRKKLIELPLEAAV